MSKTNLQLGDALQQLGDGGGDVGQLDDVALWSLGQLAQRGELVWDLLLWLEAVRKLRDEATSN